jgi:hypothetical protein
MGSIIPHGGRSCTSLPAPSMPLRFPAWRALANLSAPRTLFQGCRACRSPGTPHP